MSQTNEASQCAPDGAMNFELKPFMATTKKAHDNIEFLLRRGGVFLSATRSAVRIFHSGLAASIDTSGRVRWRT